MKKMTRHVFLQRLEKMLVNAKDNCIQCPGGKWYKIQFKPSNDTTGACEHCAEINNIAHMEFRCPCLHIGPKKAIANGWKAIDKHKEQLTKKKGGQ